MAELEVSKKTIGDLFRDGDFIIPVYQRPYEWDEDNCSQLWEDLENSFNDDSEKDYYIGSIVLAKKDNKSIIIDGQQRITSFLLLIKAMLNRIGEQTGVECLKNTFKDCLYEKDPKSGEYYFDKLKIESQLIEKDREILKLILSSNSSLDKKYNKNKYNKNYNLFSEKLKKYSEENPANNRWDDLCLYILNKTIILPIEADNMENALRIYNTVNNRGTPLTDADIFKAKIYDSFKEKYGELESLEKFSKEWELVVSITEDINIELFGKKPNDLMTQLFTYLMQCKRIESGDYETTTPSVRNHFEDKIMNEDTIKEVKYIARFLDYVSNCISVDTENRNENECGIELNKMSIKYIHALSMSGNDWWISFLIVKWYMNKDDKDFDINYFVKDMAKYFFSALITRRSGNIKGDFIKYFKFNEFENLINDNFKNTFLNLHNEAPKIIKPILYLYSYLHPDQQDLILLKQKGKSKIEIEHILPKDWKKGNYDKWTDEDAEEYVDRLGNKILLEKKINIKATNNMLKEKKKIYKESNISRVRTLSNYESDDWLKEDVEKREEEIITDIINHFGWKSKKEK